MKFTKRNALKSLGLVAAPVALAAMPKESEASEPRRNRSVFVMSNDPARNEIFVFARGSEGGIRRRQGNRGRFATGGRGRNDTAPVDPLGSQNAIVRDGNRLFAVNAGSNDVTSFEIRNDGRLMHRGIAPSGGTFPVSIASFGNLLYVVNIALGTDRPTLGVLEVAPGGGLSLRSSHDLGIPVVNDHNLAPGQVILDAQRRNLLVVDAAGQQLLSAPLDNDGNPGAFTGVPTPGPVPFSLTLSSFGHALVSEASGSVSSFDIAGNGAATLVTGAVANGQAATCWILAVSHAHAITANTLSGTLSLYGYTRDGGVSLINAVIANPGGVPTDMAVDEDGRFLYVLDAGEGAVRVYEIDTATGGLTPIASVGGLPANVGIQGIAAL